MLITFIALSLFTGSVTCKASPLTQEDSVTFTTRQMMMEQVFDLITQQLKYDIFYSENELDIRKIVQMPRLKMKLTDVLDHVLQKNSRIDSTTTTPSSSVRQNRLKRLKQYKFEARLWIKRKSLFPE